LYPGSQHTVNCLQPSILAAENALDLSPKQRKRTVMRTDGGAEVEQFLSDKNGMHLEVRRKHNFYAQQGFISLKDLAHNLLADFYQRVLLGSRFDTYGVKRIVRDLLRTPGNLVLEKRNLVCIELLSKM
jgi:hypothetical protein